MKFDTSVQLGILNNFASHCVHQFLLNKKLIPNTIKNAVFCNFYVSDHNLHNLCVNQKPVLYVVHPSGVITRIKFRNFPNHITGLLIKKLKFGHIFRRKNRHAKHANVHRIDMKFYT